jgi:hypothetical protein
MMRLTPYVVSRSRNGDQVVGGRHMLRATARTVKVTLRHSDTTIRTCAQRFIYANVQLYGQEGPQRSTGLDFERDLDVRFSF